MNKLHMIKMKMQWKYLTYGSCSSYEQDPTTLNDSTWSTQGLELGIDIQELVNHGGDNNRDDQLLYKASLEVSLNTLISAHTFEFSTFCHPILEYDFHIF